MTFKFDFIILKVNSLTKSGGIIMWRKLTTLAFILLILISLPIYQALADVYASNIRFTNPDGKTPFDGKFNDYTGAKIWFTLNDSATRVVVKVYHDVNPAHVKTFELYNLKMGEHWVYWDGTLDDGTKAPAGKWVVEITAEQHGGYSAWTMYYDDDTGAKGLNIYTRGVDINKDPKSKDFGFIYAGNSAGPIGNGIIRYRADGQPAGDAGKPLILSTKDILGANNVFHATIDYLGRVYVSRTATGDGVYRYNPSDGSLKKVVSFSGRPKGLAVSGTGNNFKLYIANGDRYNILVAKLGTDDTLTVPLDTIAVFLPDSVYVNDLVVINDSVMYVNLKKGTGTFGANPSWTEKYIIYGKTRVTRADTVWSIYWGSAANIAGIAYYNGQLFVSIRESPAGSINGVWRIWNLDAGRPSYERIFNPPLGSISSAADLTVDIVGNIIFFENTSEHIYFIAPPNGPNSFTLTAPDTINISAPGKAAKLVTLAEARKDENGDYIPDYKATGDTLLVYGVVTSPNFTASASATSYYIQDETAGLNVYKSGVLLSFDLGDYIMVVGKIDIFRGLTEIVPLTADATSIKVIEKNYPLPAPKKLTVSEFLANFERYEGQLIRLDSLWKASTSVAWPGANADANMTFTSFAKTETLTVRIDRDTDIDGQPEPKYPVSIIGIATQFTSGTTVYTGGYQISPRYYANDFITINLPPSASTLISPADSAFLRILSTDTVKFVWSKAKDGNVPEDTLIYIFKLAKDANFTSTSTVRVDTLTDTVKYVKGAELFPLFPSGDTTLVLYWRVEVTDKKSPSVKSTAFKLNLSKPTKVELAEDGIPTDYYLSQNYPNPFNPVTTIKFGLPEDAQVELVIYNILGQKVATLVNEFKRAGHYVVQFDGSNYASGTYFYVLKAGNRILKNKMLLIK